MFLDLLSYQKGFTFLPLKIYSVYWSQWYMCHRLGNQDTELTIVRNDLWGRRQMCKWVGVTLLYMCKVYHTRREKQVIVMSLGDVTVVKLMEGAGSYKGRACMSLGALVWVFGYCTFGHTSWETAVPLQHLSQCLPRSEITTLQGSILYFFSHKCPNLSWTHWVSLLQLLAS